MQKNAIVPYILIMLFGLGLIFFLSLEGVDNQEQIAEEQQEGEEGNGADAGDGGGDTDNASFDPEAHAQQNCISCHGSSYEGTGAFPALVGTSLSQEEIEDVIANGKGMMPGGLVPEENIPEMAEWILSLE